MKKDKFVIVETAPGKNYYQLFEFVPKRLYPEGSQRFRYGNEPQNPYLTGCFVLLNHDTPIGRFAFYENPKLIFNQHNVACIGSYECEKQFNSSLFLLTHAQNLAVSKGYKYLLGPMEGSTWNNYRFSLHNETPNFFLEPFHHTYYNEQFIQAGFTEFAAYKSNIDKVLQFDTDFISKMEATLARQGLKFRNLSIDDIENDLYKIADFCNENFNENFLFTPIDRTIFVSKYLTLKSYFDPQLIYIAENENGRMEGLSFSIQDFNDISGKTFVIKTLVRRKNSTFTGLGAYLAAKTYQIGAQAGFTRVIHAMMIDFNKSVSISENYHIEPYKAYSLYGKKI